MSEIHPGQAADIRIAASHARESAAQNRGLAEFLRCMIGSANRRQARAAGWIGLLSTQVEVRDAALGLLAATGDSWADELVHALPALGAGDDRLQVELVRATQAIPTRGETRQAIVLFGIAKGTFHLREAAARAAQGLDVSNVGDIPELRAALVDLMGARSQELRLRAAGLSASLGILSKESESELIAGLQSSSLDDRVLTLRVLPDAALTDAVEARLLSLIDDRERELVYDGGVLGDETEGDSIGVMVGRRLSRLRGNCDHLLGVVDPRSGTRRHAILGLARLARSPVSWDAAQPALRAGLQEEDCSVAVWCMEIASTRYDVSLWVGLLGEVAAPSCAGELAECVLRTVEWKGAVERVLRGDIGQGMANAIGTALRANRRKLVEARGVLQSAREVASAEFAEGLDELLAILNAK